VPANLLGQKGPFTVVLDYKTDPFKITSKEATFTMQ